jgi:hypothetical protein
VRNDRTELAIGAAFLIESLGNSIMPGAKPRATGRNIMAAKTTAKDIAEDELEPVADETARQAQRVVAAYAEDAEECRMLLAMLGIGPINRSE